VRLQADLDDANWRIGILEKELDVQSFDALGCASLAQGRRRPVH